MLLLFYMKTNNKSYAMEDQDFFKCFINFTYEILGWPKIFFKFLRKKLKTYFLFSPRTLLKKVFTSREFQKNIYICLIDYDKAFDRVSQQTGKFLKRWEYQAT